MSGSRTPRSLLEKSLSEELIEVDSDKLQDLLLEKQTALLELSDD